MLQRVGVKNRETKAAELVVLPSRHKILISDADAMSLLLFCPCRSVIAILLSTGVSLCICKPKRKSHKKDTRK